jgi:hypothetical protein
MTDSIINYYTKCLGNDVTPGKNKTDIVIINSNNYSDLKKYNFSVAQLKTIAKSLKIIASGTKQILLTRIYVYLYLSKFIIKIQKKIRGFLLRKSILNRGPAFLNRKICVNDRDFLTDDEVSKIEGKQFFSYTDTDNFTYGFDILSLYNLIIKSTGEIKNPYNRNIINPTIIQKLKSLIKMDKKINITIPVTESTPEKNIEFRIIELFQTINSLGNYSDSNWFSTLKKNELVKFIRELADIWHYRAQITPEMKRLICPPHGDPFRTFNFIYIQHESNVHRLQKYILTLLEIIINSGINRENRVLGSYYILGALTLVNQNASTSLPWLFQSFSYN